MTTSGIWFRKPYGLGDKSGLEGSLVSGVVLHAINMLRVITVPAYAPYCVAEAVSPWSP